MHKILYFTILFIAISVASGCQRKAPIQTEEANENDSIDLPDMITSEVSMLISDSGVIKYRATTPKWINNNKDPKNKYQYFPEGIFFEQIDSLFNTIISIEADTAYNWETKQMWHLIRNVHVVNKDGEQFSTSELYWDMREHTVYSDSFIRIRKEDAILEGYGFSSNDAFTAYTIRRTSGIFPIDTSSKSDSAQVQK